MDTKRNFSVSADEEIIEAELSSSPDAWIQPEMLRKLAEKSRIMNGEGSEEI